MRDLRVLTFILGLLFVSSTWAQPKNDPKKEAAEQFKQAEAYFKLNDFQNALEGYKKAYILSREPLLLFNIGQCYYNLKNYEKAIESYKTFLQEAPKSPQRGLAESLIKDTEAEMEKAKAKATPNPDPIKTQPETLIAVPLNTTEPASKPNETPSKQISIKLTPKLLYMVGGGAASASLLLDIFAIGAAVKARNIQQDPAGDNEDISTPFRRARVMGVFADLFLLSGAGAAGYGYWLSKSVKKNEVSMAISPSGATVKVSF